MKRLLLLCAFLAFLAVPAFAQEGSEISGGGSGGGGGIGGSGTAGAIPKFASTTTLGDSKLVTSGANNGTLTLYDDTAVTGASQLNIRAGAADAVGNPYLFQILDSGNNVAAAWRVYEAGTAVQFVTRNSYSLTITDGSYHWGQGLDWGGIRLASDYGILWNSGTDIQSLSPDLGLARASAGVLKVTDGSSGAGSLTLGNILPFADTTYNIGDSTHRVSKLWVGALDNNGGAINFNLPGGQFFSMTGSGSSVDLNAGGANDIRFYANGLSNYVVTRSPLQFASGTWVDGTSTCALTDNTIKTFATVSAPTSDSVVAGKVYYTIEAVDATNHKLQSITGVAPFTISNRNGTVTAAFGTVATTASDVTDSATFTNTFATSISGTTANLRITSDYDQATLSGTVTSKIRSRIEIDAGTATVAMQP